MLQIRLLTAKEIAAVLKMDWQIAQQVGLGKAAKSAEIGELTQHTCIEYVVQTIKTNSLPTLDR